MIILYTYGPVSFYGFSISCVPTQVSLFDGFLYFAASRRRLFHLVPRWSLRAYSRTTLFLAGLQSIDASVPATRPGFRRYGYVPVIDDEISGCLSRRFSSRPHAHYASFTMTLQVRIATPRGRAARSEKAIGASAYLSLSFSCLSGGYILIDYTA